MRTLSITRNQFAKITVHVLYGLPQTADVIPNTGLGSGLVGLVM